MKTKYLLSLLEFAVGSSVILTVVAFATEPAEDIPVNPEPSPTNLLAVTIPDTLTSPPTVNLDVGFVVPIPTLESV